MLTKKCPFCKEEIDKEDTTCPKCQRVLVEIIKSPSQSGINNQPDILNRKKSKKYSFVFISKLKHFFTKLFSKFKRKEKIYTYQFDKWRKYKRIIFILAGIIIVILIINLDNEPEPNQNNQINNLTSVPTKINTKPSSEYVSLANGTILNSSPLYLKGLGELKIENGTDKDAVAKLVRLHPLQSIYTVYIKTKRTYTITDISDGYYDLYFAHGQDWDGINKKFLVNASYSKFEDGFDFTTKDEYSSGGINSRYTVFEVTLHPVPGGSAETDKVSENEFNQF
jgi:hypothetical protein